ncbi:hypothetical protein KVR01_012087 [Diaporthe batatas]|uniref:uncharacterized protein n=1 Tax=Diaporthe batatas TaxID=748121 RepID=UPI001D059534|nr:uncharacterized protein KVR01_012087 [Diaporthe batatas]KAG8158326.1 hypothetical protein KVR01_012087 [Diaporthe batatas]
MPSLDISSNHLEASANGHHLPADLRQMQARLPLPSVAPGTIDHASMTDEEAAVQARDVLQTMNKALAAGDVKALAECFFPGQAYWKDQLSLTWHLRTLTGPETIAAGLIETSRLRALAGEIEFTKAQFTPAAPTLQFIESDLTFRTGSPQATCSGRLLLLPLRSEHGGVEWKVWILSTKLENLDLQPENESLLLKPSEPLSGAETLETDVFIIGGGNAAVALAARLKALGVASMMGERNPRPGDNWDRRYESLKFHIPTSFCELPYMNYDKMLQTPHLLTRAELGEQVRRYVDRFGLQMINSASIRSAEFDDLQKRWTIDLETPGGRRTVRSKHLVQATGVGSQIPYTPSIAGRELFQGISLHSADYKNATKDIKDKGLKSVVVIGSANTAFDVVQDCHDAGLHTTINARSPTYVVPLDYVCHEMSLGAYDSPAGVEAIDKMFLTLPQVVASQISKGLFAALASNEPNRYAKLAEAGFPVFDSAHPDADLMSNLLEQAGGHYVDVGTTKLIEDGRVSVKAGVEPVAYTATGLRFSDGTTVDTDAVVWCTGFADRDTRVLASTILPPETAARLDGTWGLDEEGEVRGMWKRQREVENYWVTGGYTQQHRYYSRTLALQIKAALEGLLPPAYLETPSS